MARRRQRRRRMRRTWTSEAPSSGEGVAAFSMGMAKNRACPPENQGGAAIPARRLPGEREADAQDDVVELHFADVLGLAAAVHQAAVGDPVRVELVGGAA